MRQRLTHTMIRRRDAPHSSKMLGSSASYRWVFAILCLIGNALHSFAKEARRRPWRHRRHFALAPHRLSIANMTCQFFEQPLNHFVPRGTGATYRQRYCIYDGYINHTADEPSPIFLYTGNESPLEEYINNTGLIWELSPNFQAQVAFFEHRYEGESLPRNLSEDCMSYASSIQALADYVNLLDYLNPRSIRPVIAFGGSYGGMLSSWLRMKYPSSVAGAIAGSAPIWGFPRVARPDSIDTAARVVTRALSLSYPPTDTPRDRAANHCVDNLLATWPLMTYLGASVHGRLELQDSFRLCQPLHSIHDVEQLREWAQSPWFDMAEGSFPYPSSYIPFALHMGDHNLPAWPLQAACWKNSSLHKDWGTRFEYPGGTNRTDVRYKITYGDSEIVLSVDWDDVVAISETSSAHSPLSSKSVRGLLASVRDAVAVWFNVTLDQPCFNITPAENSESLDDTTTSAMADAWRTLTDHDDSPVQMCNDEIASQGSWGPLCCNEDINLVNVETNGLGRDFYWPPSYPRGTTTYADIVRTQSRNNTDDYCADPDGVFGYPQANDPWSTWLDSYYGGLRIGSYSNIVFSNGLLDPWSAAGVYAPGLDPTPKEDHSSPYSGPFVQNITQNGSIVAILIEFGGHHTDLMYSSSSDPECVKEARRIEAMHIAQWIQEWHTGRQGMTPMEQPLPQKPRAGLEHSEESMMMMMMMM